MHVYNKYTLKREKCEAAKVKAEDTVFNTVGPRGIQKLVIFDYLPLDRFFV